MINAFEFTILNHFKAFWKDVVANIGQPNDYIQDIFSSLPADGDYGANQKAIAELFTTLSSGDDIKDLIIQLGFPVSKAALPSITIESGTDVENEVVGSFVEENYNANTGKWEVQEGGPWQKTYRVGIYAFDPDTTLYLYSLAKYGLLILRNTLVESAAFHISGQPLAADYQRFAPDTVYLRFIDITVEGLLDTAVSRYDKVVRIGIDPITQ